MREYTAKGRLAFTWKHIAGPNISHAVVGKSGLVWSTLALTGFEGFPGIPVMALRPETQKPVIDWTKKVPDWIESAIATELSHRGLIFKGPFGVEDIQQGGGLINIRLFGDCLGTVDGAQRTLNLTITDDGRRVISAKLYDGAPPNLAPSGIMWSRDSDLNFKDWRWKRMGIKFANQPTRWLIDLDKPEPWTREVTYRGPHDHINTIPIFFPDGAGNVYIRGFRTRSTNEESLIVLNKANKVVARIPWQACGYVDFDSWIAPVPTGTGFYRLERRGNRYVVYFQKLPPQKK